MCTELSRTAARNLPTLARGLKRDGAIAQLRCCIGSEQERREAGESEADVRAAAVGDAQGHNGGRWDRVGAADGHLSSNVVATPSRESAGNGGSRCSVPEVPGRVAGGEELTRIQLIKRASVIREEARRSTSIRYRPVAISWRSSPTRAQFTPLERRALASTCSSDSTTSKSISVSMDGADARTRLRHCCCALGARSAQVSSPILLSRFASDTPVGREMMFYRASGVTSARGGEEARAWAPRLSAACGRRNGSVLQDSGPVSSPCPRPSRY